MRKVSTVIKISASWLELCKTHPTVHLKYRYFVVCKWYLEDRLRKRNKQKYDLCVTQQVGNVALHLTWNWATEYWKNEPQTLYHTSQLCKARNNCMTFDGTLHSQNMEPNKEKVWPLRSWDLRGEMVLARTSQASKHFKDKTLWSFPEARRQPPWPAEALLRHGGGEVTP